MTLCTEIIDLIRLDGAGNSVKGMAIIQISIDEAQTEDLLPIRVFWEPFAFSGHPWD